MSESTLIAYDHKLTRQELALVPTPLGTATHQTIPHHEVVNALVETLGFRHIGVLRDESAVDRTGAKMFGLMVLDQGMHGASFALEIRNSHDKSFRLSITVGYEVFVCQNMAFKGDFEPVRQRRLNLKPAPEETTTSAPAPVINHYRQLDHLGQADQAWLHRRRRPQGSGEPSGRLPHSRCVGISGC